MVWIKCPGTPKGAFVDEFGCPKDSDNDGFSMVSISAPELLRVQRLTLQDAQLILMAMGC
jgi:hypothetical protein